MNRRFAVLLGFMFSTVFVAGVAVAEPEPGTSARATVGEDGPEASSVLGEQYSDTGEDDASIDDDGGGDDDAGREDLSSRESGPPQDSGQGSEQGQPLSAAASSAGARAEVGGGSRQEARTSRTTLIQQSESRQVSRQTQTPQSGGGDRVQQQQQRSVSRESNGSGESTGAGEPRSSAGRVEARAVARTVQSPEIRARMRDLQEKERAGDLGPAATSEAKERRSRELRIARDEIVSQPVNEASLKRYKKLYEESAEEYGFGDDWYVLAAVGEVESDHGQNMGPSSAGAMGPMQFMPSTWDSYGLDANDDGKANVMDPEDAIPSAARYLKAGGAPDDWYEALYTYNNAGWYVEKVLKVAEGYRQAAGDDEVGPYYGDR